MINFGPFGAATPFLSPLMLVLLALLMTVVAFRVLRAGAGNINRLVGLMVLAGGMVLTGYNIKYGFANGGVTVTDASECNNVTLRDFNEYSEIHETFLNSCPNALKILDITVDCDEGPFIDGTCMIGDVVAAGNSCTLPICDVRNF